MTFLQNLWLPILLSSVFVFIASSIIHTVLPWHKGDYRKVPAQDKVMDALRPFATPPGDYMVPMCANSAEMKSPEYAEKLNKGPVMMLTVLPNGPISMGKSLGLWFLYLVVVSFFAGYVTWHALPGGADYLKVFRFAGATSFLAFSGALWQMSIWYRRSWSTALKDTLDGLIYAGLTAGTFGWLWPRQLRAANRRAAETASRTVGQLHRSWFRRRKELGAFTQDCSNLGTMPDLPSF